jgi:hypothetical protein
MTASMASEDDRTIVLRRQRKVRVVEGKPEGVYTNTFEIICRGCGDDPFWDYHDVSPRLQRIRGRYWLETGAREYEAHIAWHEAQATRGDGHCFASVG